MAKKNAQATEQTQEIVAQSTTKAGHPAVNVEHGELPPENSERKQRTKANSVTSRVLELRNGGFIKEPRLKNGGAQSYNHWAIVNAAKANNMVLRSYISNIDGVDHDVFVYVREMSAEEIEAKKASSKKKSADAETVSE